jgi:hypothetical protein
MIGTCLRAAAVIAFAVVMSWSSAQLTLAGEAEDSWPEIANNAFNGRPLADGSKLIALEMQPSFQSPCGSICLLVTRARLSLSHW